MYVPQLLHLPSVMLMSFSATPAIEYFAQSTGLYFGGDANAFHARYPAPVTLLVSYDWHFAVRLLTPFLDVRVRPDLISFRWLLAMDTMDAHHLLSDFSLIYYTGLCHPRTLFMTNFYLPNVCVGCHLVTQDPGDRLSLSS